MRFLDKATQSDPNMNVHFISLFSGGLKEFEARRSKGYPAAIIHGEMVSKNYTTFLHDIHKHLNASDPNNSPVLYEISSVTNESSKHLHALVFRNGFLIEDLIF